LVVAQLLETPTCRERGIVRLRFNEEMSQVEIVGVSRMRVSRLLKRAFADLRVADGAGDG